MRLTLSRRRLQADDDPSDVTANVCPDPNTQRMCTPVTNVTIICPTKNNSDDNNSTFYMLPAIMPSPSPPPPTPPPLIPPTPSRSSLPAMIVALLEAVGLLTCILLRQRLLRRYRARESEVKRLSLLEAGSDDLLREFQFDVFISYRREDFAMVDQIASYVREAAALPGCSEGLRVFKDRDGYMTGQPFDIFLMDALAASAVFCPIISLSALRQLVAVTPHETDYTLVEYILAPHYKMLGRLRGIVPLLVGPSMMWTATFSYSTCRATRSSSACGKPYQT